MQTTRAKRCPDCYGSKFLWGDGRCSGCGASGYNLNLSRPEQVCARCSGTGICSSCNGSGRLKGQSLALYQPRSLQGRFVLFPLLFVGICTIGFRYAQSRYLSKAVAAAELTHRELFRGRVSQVYVNADERFRLGISFDSALKQMEALRKRLGDCTYSSPAAWSVSATTNGIFVVTKYHGFCTNAESRETMRWHIVNGVAKLSAFHVDSTPSASSK